MELTSSYKPFPITGRGWVYTIDCKKNGIDYTKKEDRPINLGDEVTVDGETFRVYAIDDWHYLAHKFSESIGLMKEDKNAQ